LCASTRSSVATQLCAGSYSRRWSHCYVKTSLFVFYFAEVSRRGWYVCIAYSRHPSPSPGLCPIDGPRVSSARGIVSCRKALQDHHIEPLPLSEKETLGIVNKTAFSASVASLALHDAAHLALLAQVCTTMGTEALLGVRANYDPFLHEVVRPHPGQVRP
jgi:hypothetical protein